MSQWKTVYEADYDGRHVEVRVYGDRESFQVRTTLKTMADDPALTRVYSEGEPIDIDAETTDQLIRELIANEFSERDAREMAVHARGEDMPKRFVFDHDRRRTEVSGTFGEGVFQVLQFAEGSHRLLSVDGNAPTTQLQSIHAANQPALMAQIDARFPGHGDVQQA